MICRMTHDEETVKKALDMWMQRVPIRVIAFELDITYNQMLNIRDTNGFPPRERALTRSLGDPTREEIEEMCKDIRERWSVATRRERIAWKR
jgi:hypothetical protein